MLIVDAQVHIWGSGTPTNANHRQVAAFTKDELLKEMDAAGVDARGDPSAGVWDPNANELAVEAARQHPDRLAILGNFPLDRPESRGADRRLEAAAGNARLALRVPAAAPEDLADRRHDRLAVAGGRARRAAGRRCSRRTSCPRSREVAAEASGAEADHRSPRPAVGRPRTTRPGRTCRELLALAKYPNVAIKATGAPSYSSEPYPYRNIHGHLKRIFDAFGPERMFWGTDITRMPCSWRQCVTMFTEELPWLKGRDLELVMGRAVCDWLGWKIPAR